MKKLYLTLALIAAVILTACNQADEPTPTSDNENLISNTSSNFISQQDALCIASKVLGNSTRSIGQNFPEVEYVVSKATTRSSNILSDTLAYVINYPNDGGFVIIASDNRVYPVLGFSNTGSFSFDNEIATTNFISNIEAYLEQADKSASYEVSDSDFDGCYSTAPAIQISLGQVDPWNKYVIKEHPGCPAGCVAIATALVMSHSRNDILYHGVNYPLNTIISAIKTGQSKNISQVSDIPKSNNSSKFPIDTVSIGELPFPFEPMYTYEMAVDSMAKIIYHIGKDVGMSYSPSGSGAFSYNAYKLCESLDMMIPSGYANFDINEVMRYLNAGCIVYLRGRDTNNKGGHAWVSDGCYFCVDDKDPSVIIDGYINCDWGWYGSCNGYYSGSVFEAGEYNFKPENYFAVKDERKPYSFSHK